MPAYSAFLVIHIIFAAVAIPLLCYSLYKLYRSKPFNTKWTLSHIYLTSLLITIFCLPTSLVHGTNLFVLSPADKNTTVVNIADKILPAHSPLCVIQAQVLSFLLSPYILLPVLLSFYTFNAIRKNKASLESQSFKYAAIAIWGLGGVILIGNILSWHSQITQEENTHHNHDLTRRNESEGIQARGWILVGIYLLLILGGTYDGMYSEESEELTGKDGLEDGSITVSELRFTYFV
ncbi:9777_t:CDS:2 [Paraglomus occultum]|uniref:9777_t:CDS:1 n=1 Tax=Paraglomus occultum TaxID=144539 RepID=A0A9N9BZF9_9GLOM|nr:9777_t:CDS:2 [Paraglomus occultum]